MTILRDSLQSPGMKDQGCSYNNFNNEIMLLLGDIQGGPSQEPVQSDISVAFDEITELKFAPIPTNIISFGLGLKMTAEGLVHLHN
jgi:hypothetical protein